MCYNTQQIVQAELQTKRVSGCRLQTLIHDIGKWAFPTTIVLCFNERQYFFQSSSEKLTFSDFAKPVAYKPLVIVLGLMFFQQASGINAVIFYAKNIFKTAGFANDPSLPQILVGK